MSLVPYALRVESLKRAECIDVASPRFTWRLSGGQTAEDPEAFRITVRAVGLTGECETTWRSGWIDFVGINGVDYAGAPLRSLTTYEWELAVRSTQGETSTAGGDFRTGILHPDEWCASWIERDPRYEPSRMPPEPDDGLTDRVRPLQAPDRFRREFSVGTGVIRAVLAYTARGVVRAFVNGERVDDAELTPGWTDYRARIQYRAVDVTGLLNAGANVLGAIVGDGWWAGMVGFDPRRQGAHYGERPALLAQLVLDYDDGRREVLVTDDSWHRSRGPLRHSDFLMGEWRDGRVDDTAWHLPGADENGWAPVRRLEHTGVALVGERDEPIRVVEELEPQSVEQRRPGVWVVDFGQNLVGRLSVRFTGLGEGEHIVLSHAEALDADGDLYVANLRTADSRDHYIGAGFDEEHYEPIFTTHGFRYAQIEFPAGSSGAFEVRAQVMHNDFDFLGEFTSSDALISRIDANVRWGLRGNFLAVPTDCPQRDERLGWLADAQVFAPTALMHADVAPFYGRWMRDVILAQRPDGAFPNFVPLVQTGQREGAPGWGDGALIIPWEAYRSSGDVRLLEETYDGMKGWVDRILRLNPNGLWTEGVGNNYGDWLQIDADTPRDLVSTAYLARSLWITARVAAILGAAEDEAHYAAARERVAVAFMTRFLDPETGAVGNDTQTGYLMTLAWDLAPDELRPALAERLVKDIRSRGNRLTTGFLGVSLLAPVLDRFGYPEVALDLVRQTEFPSWGYSIAHGATTIWERWDGWTEDHGFQTADMNSFNHYSLGSVGEWLYHGLAGVDQDVDSVGYRRLLFRPHIGRGLGSTGAVLETPLGRVESTWSVSDGAVDYVVEVPPGATATVELPAKDATGVQLGGVPLAEAAGVSRVRASERGLRATVSSGRFRFQFLES